MTRISAVLFNVDGTLVDTTYLNAAATSSGDAAERKPAPDVPQIALERSGATPDAAVFVGDTRLGRAGMQESGTCSKNLRTWSVGPDGTVKYLAGSDVYGL